MNLFKHKIHIMLGIITILSTLLLLGCTNSEAESEPISVTTLQFGTVIQVTVFHSDDEPALNKVLEHMGTLENEMSTSIADSNVSVFNNAKAMTEIQLGEHTQKVVERSLYYSELSNGKFDITIEPIVELWGIGEEHAKIPNQNELNQSLPKVDYRKLEYNDVTGTLQKTEDGIMIDLGAIAKGYAADEAIRILKEEGVMDALVNLGGNVYALGSKEGFPWKVGIQDPLEPQGAMVGVVDVKDQAVITSGVYERYFESDGVRYHHLIDPDTGYPINNEILGISIISASAIDGDALSTVIYTMGLDAGMEMVESINGVEAIFITRDKTIYVSTGASEIFDKRNSGYNLISSATKEN